MKFPILIAALLLLHGNCLKAQLNYPRGTTLFDGIHNFSHDSALVDMVKKNKVKSVKQVVTTRTYTFAYGEFTFNEMGQVIDMLTQQGRIAYAYAGALCVKSIRYAKTDSIESWVNYIYDNKNRLLKTEQNYYQEKRLNTYVDKESKLVSENKNCTRWETTDYGYQDIYTISQVIDSTNNNAHYKIEYKYRPKDVDEKGRKRGNKTLTKTYIKDNCKYEIVVKYKVYGRLESPDDIKTNYYQGDKNGHLIEFGDIDYGPAMEQYISLHPEEFSYGTLPPNFIKAILSGEFNTSREAKIKQVYDAKGRMIEKNHYDTRYTFHYNAKGQLHEQIKEGKYPRKDELFYNEKGLIIRVLTTGYTTESGDKTVVLEESNFTYTYY